MNVLAINPWIYDFAAYDYWIKPYGFLIILSYLQNQGFNIKYIDCLDSIIKKGFYGTGKFYSEKIKTPEKLKHIPRYYKKYGITNNQLTKQLENFNPDIILITSSMTYWYPSIIDLIKILKERYKSVPVILGGTYATLCYTHAKKNIPCDYIFTHAESDKFFNKINVPFNHKEFYSTLPEYEKFYDNLEYVVLRTSWGCPFSCSYCAIKSLSDKIITVDTDLILNYIIYYNKLGIKNFVFYDDALLYQSEIFKNFLQQIIRLKLNINFHTPNAMHIKYLDMEMAHLMKLSGFINPRFGLETLEEPLQKLWSNKLNNEILNRGIECLKQSGYGKGEFSFYMLFGYPGQNIERLFLDIEYLNSLGARVLLSEYSHVPKTKLFASANKIYDEPLFHNNSIFSSFEPEKIKYLWSVKNKITKLQLI